MSFKSSHHQACDHTQNNGSHSAVTALYFESCTCCCCASFNPQLKHQRFLWWVSKDPWCTVSNETFMFVSKMSLKLHLNIWISIIIIIWWIWVSLKSYLKNIALKRKTYLSSIGEELIIFFLERQTDINKRCKPGWKQKQQQKTLHTPKVWAADSCIKKTWKIPVVYLKTWASPFIAALIRVTHSDPGREQNNTKKRNSSHSWLTALINKREGGGWGGVGGGALCAFPPAASGRRIVITGKCQKTILDFPN